MIKNEMTGWSGETETRKTLIPTGGFTANGKPKMRPVYHRYIYLSKVWPSGHRSEIKFTVTRNKNGTVITDDRETLTGAAQHTNKQFQTEEYCKPGKKKSMTPIAWIAEVSPRLITKEQANQLIESF